MDVRVREESENLRKLDLKISRFRETPGVLFVIVRQAPKDMTTNNLKLNNLQNDHAYLDKEIMAALSLLQGYVPKLNQVFEIGECPLILEARQLDSSLFQESLNDPRTGTNQTNIIHFVIRRRSLQRAGCKLSKTSHEALVHIADGESGTSDME
eukprot:749821-Hanusia_phi.AAC.11